MRTLLLCLLGLIHGLATAPGPLPPYRPARPVSGSLTLVGSDSMDPLLLLWIAEFRKLHPEARLDAVSKGSLTAPPALAEGRTVLGPMSRPMKEAEVELVAKALGYRPLQVVVAYDALAIWVHRDNPLRRLRMEQLDAIFSSTRNLGWERPIRTWGALGLRGAWRRRTVVPYGRDELSGTRSFFDEHALAKGKVAPTFRVAGDQWAVVEAPGRDARGISYGPINYAEPLVHQVALIPRGGHEAQLPTPAAVAEGRYPLTRTLSIYAATDADHPLPEVAREFLRFILSREGQALVSGYGSVSVAPELAEAQLAQLEGR